MANRTSNRKARRLLGISYRISNKPNNIVIPFRTPDTGRWQLPEHLQSHDVVAAKLSYYMLCGMKCDCCAYYPITAFYPTYVGKPLK